MTTCTSLSWALIFAFNKFTPSRFSSSERVRRLRSGEFFEVSRGRAVNGMVVDRLNRPLRSDLRWALSATWTVHVERAVPRRWSATHEQLTVAKCLKFRKSPTASAFKSTCLSDIYATYVPICALGSCFPASGRVGWPPSGLGLRRALKSAAIRVPPGWTYLGLIVCFVLCLLNGR